MVDIIVDFFEIEKCGNKAWSELPLKCVREKGHQGKHQFYIEWNDYTE